MILHFSHIGLTDGRTFTLLFALVVTICSVLQPGSGDRPGRRYRAAERAAQSRALRTHPGILARWLRPGQAAAARPPPTSCQGVRILGPSAVTAIVNSKWAASEP